MTIKKLILSLTLLLATAGPATAQQTGPLVLTGLVEYQLTGLSSNGNWACGVFVNATGQNYAFRWNLKTDKCELLSGEEIQSMAYNISNNGVVAGEFYDTQATANGAPVLSAGYWNGQWHHQQNIDNLPTISTQEYVKGYAISDDDQYLGGAGRDADNLLTPIIWKDNKILHSFANGYAGMIYAVSPDGTMATGWSTPPGSSGTRVSTLWRAGQKPLFLTDIDDGSPWNSGRSFSSDGKKLLFWGGFHDERDADPANGSTVFLNCIYDIETGQVSGVPTITGDAFNFEMYDINCNGTVVGYEQGMETMQRAIICKNGKTQYLEDYLTALGVDFSSVPDLRKDAETGSYHMILNCVGLSDDEKTFAFVAYDNENGIRPLIVKLDHPLSMLPAVQPAAKQIDGVAVVKLTWKAPIAGAAGVKGYHVLRNGAQITDTPLTACQYFDKDVTEGNSYTYAVKAVYADGQSEASESVSVSVGKKEISAPLTFGVRQKGLNSALLQWAKPLSNLTVKSYFDPNAQLEGFGAGPTSFECAICFPADEMALYAGQQFRSVSFCPLSEQQAWTVNIYSRKPGAKAELIYTQPVTQKLTYGTANTVQLTQPLAIAAGADYLLAIDVTAANRAENVNVMGMVYGQVEAGYSDLVRQRGEAELYSLHEAATALNQTFPLAWAISATVAPADAPADIDQVKDYLVYLDGQEAATTRQLEFTLQGVADGSHHFGVAARYADGRLSPAVTLQADIRTNTAAYRPIESVYVDHPSLTSITAGWIAPTDNDQTDITYASGTPQGGVLGSAEDNYSYMAAAIYPADRLKSYKGYRVESFKFYPLATADFTFLLTAGGEIVAEVNAGTEYEVGKWNTVRLETPLYLEAGKDYTLILDCYDVAYEQAPLAIDSQMPFIGLSDIYSLDGENFASVSGAASVYGNWMIGMTVSAPEAADPLPVEGYHVSIDGRRVTALPLGETTFSHDFKTEDTKAHTIRVDVVYEVHGTVNGKVTTFHIGAADIDPSTVARLSVTTAGGLLVADGPGVTSVALHSASGRPAARAEGNCLDISSLPAAPYILTIVQNGRTQTRKLLITK